EPIAIIGMACRFPGAATPEAFWDLIERGGDAIREVPPARWDNQAIYDADTSRPGTTNARKGGFLDDVELFDAPFFGISPREAARMDPQQRLFLEVAWEALEDAGQDVDALAGSDTGVFVGLHGHANDYFWFDVPHPERMDAFTGPGTSHNIVAGRLSYLYDFQGPAMVVDTACSSSLVAIHLACQSLRSTECSLALAGGVNLVLSPVFTIALSRLGMLSPDGHCRAFDAGANGFVRSEGCGVVTLKRLADARAAGDRVLAVIRGSAVNQDGRTNGITAPSSPSQQRVISRALANAGVSAGQISYVEAHGTGTELGDPIEVEALSAVVGASPQAQPCFLGSAKANVGHLEGAAGVAGVIKTVLALQHKTIPPLALFRTLNPHISLDGTRLSIPVAAQPWDADRRIAGVSSFGWSGTNAHVVIEEAPEHDAPVVRPSSAAVLPVSARSEGALRELAAAYASLLQSNPEDFHRISAAASRRRTHHDFRAAVAGASAADLISALNDYAAGKPTWNAAADRAVAGRTVPIAFVFSGQGPQWAGMGQQLLAANDAFRDAVTQVSRLLEPLAGWSLLSELAAEPGRSRLQDTAVAQPALFALQVGLAAAFKAAGVEPGAVVGHSIGEVAAAHVSGALDLDEAVRVVFHRSRVMQQATGHGRMVAVELPASEVEQVIGRDAGLVSIASINAPRSCVISGEPATVEAITARLESSNIICRPLPVNYAFHSVQMEAPAAELRAALGTVRREATQLPLVSTVTGEVIAGTALDADYWCRNVRGSVMFAKAMSTLQARGHQLFLELSPHPVLATSIRACGRGDSAPVAVASLQRGKDEPTAVMAAIGAIYTKGYAVNWRRVYDAAPPMTLPRYPFQRSRYWLPEGGASRAGLSASAPPSVEARNELSAPGRR
ncbi:MAG TPA: type I polyketide synthase, partial [Vicinamibacterales bacterium]|nr:type I polyketide synthase [Vicinamibacterales bacterium]